MITLARRFAVSLFISTLVACAEGTGASLLTGDAGAINAGQPMCGNGKIEPANNEMCECPAGSSGPCAVTDKDCSELGGTGTLMCDPTTCMYIDDACTNTGTGGNGGGGTSG
jgi:hypothetical protein